MTINDTFTSTGSKLFAHQEAMAKLRNGRGQPITCHIMATDICNHSCAFCSVQARAGDSLLFNEITGFIDILLGFGLKSVILSGGGNPILYRCKETGKNINDVVDAIHERGLEIGLITNGMLLRKYEYDRIGPVRYIVDTPLPEHFVRESWATVHPETLDKLTWVRISMSGLDHPEREVYVPEIDPSKTTLGFSYVGHDIYTELADPHHGKVSRPADLLSGDMHRAPTRCFEERFTEISDAIAEYVDLYNPRYVRLLPNCLEPQLIQRRCEELQRMADMIDPRVVFVQYKPPQAPKACYLGYVHPVLNCDGYCYPCDSCVLNEAAGHRFGETWRVCHWSEVGKLYEQPVRSLIDNPAKQCPGCVFTKSNELLGEVVDGTIDLIPPGSTPEHVNFV